MADKKDLTKALMLSKIRIMPHEDPLYIGVLTNLEREMQKTLSDIKEVRNLDEFK